MSCEDDVELGNFRDVESCTVDEFAHDEAEVEKEDEAEVEDEELLKIPG